MLLVAVALIVLARLSFYTVDAAEYVYVTILGHHPDWGTYDGADAQNGAGLKLGWPWPIQQVQRLDRRLQQFDLPAFEQLTHDPKGNTIDKILLIEAYVCWKIADRDAVDRFVRRIGSAERARAILAPRINSQLGAAIGQKRMDDLVNTTVRRSSRPARRRSMSKPNCSATSCWQHWRRSGPRRVRHRADRHSPAPFQSSRQRAGLDLTAHPQLERNKIVAEHDSQGKLKASNIGSETEEKLRDMLAQASAAEEKIKADADTEAMMISQYGCSSQDPEFYAFLRKMEKLQSILGDSKTMLLLSTHRPLFESLFQPPRAQAAPAKDKKGDN